MAAPPARMRPTAGSRANGRVETVLQLRCGADRDLHDVGPITRAPASRFFETPAVIGLA